jgi:hypothetical protein
MGTKQFSNYDDLLTFTRASKGHALRPVSYGTELVTNGTFDSDLSGWTAGSSWSWVSGKAYDGDTQAGSHAELEQSISVTSGKVYAISFDISGLSGGNPSVSWAGSTLVQITADASYTEYVVATGSSHTLQFSGQNALYYVDNVSVKEVLFDQPDGTLTLFEHPDNIPRVEYDADGNRLGLLVEEARTNLVVQSEFAGTWQQSPPLALNLNQGTSPDQQNNAAEVTITGGGFVYANVAVNASTQYTFSWYAKLNTATAHVYAFYDNSNNTFIERNEYTLTDGEDVGNGWYRQSKTFTTPSGCTSIRVYPLRETVDGGGSPTGVTGDTFIYGAQLEAGSFPTSYIKNEGTSSGVTRSADVASIPVADFGYNQSAGSIVIESQTFDITDVGRNFSLSDGTSSNVIRSQSQASNHLIVFKSGTLTANLDAGSYSNNVFSKLGGAFAEDDIAACIDGGTVATDTSSSIPTVTKLNIGGRYDGGLPLNGHIKSIQYYPRRLSNAQLQDLTS